MRIWKFPLVVTGMQSIDMPKGAKVLSIQVQRDGPHLWALVDETAPNEPRTFATYATGEQLPEAYNYGRFVGTYQLGASIVLHVFDQSKEVA
jgi:hypothetical protein